MRQERDLANDERIGVPDASRGSRRWRCLWYRLYDAYTLSRGETRGGRVLPGRRRRTLSRQVSQRKGEHFVHRAHRMEAQPIANVLGELAQLALVLPRNDEVPDAAAQSGDRLLFESADGEHASTKRHFAGHGHVALDRRSGERTGQCNGDGHAR